MFRRRSKISFEEEFDLAYARICADAPANSSDRREWATATLKPFQYPGPQYLALDWFDTELRDAKAAAEQSNMSERPSILWTSYWAEEELLDALPLLVRLGSDMLEEGSLGPPYDEILWFPGIVYDAGPDHLDAYDPGPSRLAALIVITAFSVRIGDSRRSNWRQLPRQTSTRGERRMPPGSRPRRRQGRVVNEMRPRGSR